MSKWKPLASATNEERLRRYVAEYWFDTPASVEFRADGSVIKNGRKMAGHRVVKTGRGWYFEREVLA